MRKINEMAGQSLRSPMERMRVVSRRWLYEVLSSLEDVFQISGCRIRRAKHTKVTRQRKETVGEIR